jgi:hypothetical protein
MISQYHSSPAAVDLGLLGKLITELRRLEKRIVWADLGAMGMSDA